MSETLSSFIPVELAEIGEKFIPCAKTLEWIRSSFLNEDSALYNVEHDHLNSAAIGFLWTNAPNSRHGKTIVGTAELASPPPSLNKWAKARWIHQLRQWFGNVDLDFIITLYAPYFAGAAEIEQCSGAEHELYHCGQKLDMFGLPSFQKDGRPKFTIRGHDVEEFVGIWKRYGAPAGAGDSLALAAAVKQKPEVDFAGMCGTCR